MENELAIEESYPADLDDGAVNDLELEQIAKFIAAGFTDGILEVEGYRTIWKLRLEKFEL